MGDAELRALTTTLAVAATVAVLLRLACDLAERYLEAAEDVRRQDVIDAEKRALRRAARQQEHAQARARYAHTGRVSLPPPEDGGQLSLPRRRS